MAEPLSVAASVVGLIALADRVIRVSQYCIDTIKDAPSDVRMILGETISLRAVFESLTDTGSGPATRLLGVDDPIEACRRCLTALEALLPQRHGSVRHIAIADLAWPFKAPKARKILAEISQHKATLLLAISRDMLHDLRVTRTVMDRVHDVISDSERHRVSEWLEHTNPSPLHNTAINKHEPLTSSWLPRSPEWVSWLDPSVRVRFLWVYGIPGAGKTVLASFAIEELKKLCDSRVGYLCAYYYCHYSHGQDEAAPFLSWVVSQVCRQTKHLPCMLKDLHDRGCDPTVSELQHTLEAALERVDCLFVVVDAVDESSPREGLVRLIANLVLDTRFSKVRIMATSRQYLDIERVFLGISTSISMSNSVVDVDIRRFVRARLAASPRLKRWQRLLSKIEDRLVMAAHGMFRLVDCQIHAIERVRDEPRLYAALENLPHDLTETYNRIFDAIPKEDRPFVRHVLLWLCGHMRAPWVVREAIDVDLLLSAVACELYGPRSRHSFDCDYLQELLGCLINVDANKDGVVVSLAHYTVLEFLTSEHILHTRAAFFALPVDFIKTEFATSVLKRALAADPAGTSASWEHDHEAYCLTLGCALSSWGGDDVCRLFIEYLNPANPHYVRFAAIQERIQSDDNNSFGFFLGCLPATLSTPSAAGGHDAAAEVLFNVLLLPERFQTFIHNVLRLAGGRSMQDLMRVMVSGFFIAISSDGELSRRNFEGTVGEVVRGSDVPSGFHRLRERIFDINHDGLGRLMTDDLNLRL